LAAVLQVCLSTNDLPQAQPAISWAARHQIKAIFFGILLALFQHGPIGTSQATWIGDRGSTRRTAGSLSGYCCFSGSISIVLYAARWFRWLGGAAIVTFTSIVAAARKLVCSPVVVIVFRRRLGSWLPKVSKACCAFTKPEVFLITVVLAMHRHVCVVTSPISGFRWHVVPFIAGEWSWRIRNNSHQGNSRGTSFSRRFQTASF
jgi:hypothetical protein